MDWCITGSKLFPLESEISIKALNYLMDIVYDAVREALARAYC